MVAGSMPNEAAAAAAASRLTPMTRPAGATRSVSNATPDRPATEMRPAPSCSHAPSPAGRCRAENRTTRPAARSAKRRCHGSSALSTSAPSGGCPSAMTSLSCRYSSMDPYRFWWSRSRLVTTATGGASTPRPRRSPNCQEDSSSTTGVSAVSSSRKSSGEPPMLPLRRVAGASSPRIAASAAAVVDFPLLPVTARTGARQRARNSDCSVSTAAPAAQAAARNGESGRTPGFLTTRSQPVKSSIRWLPRLTRTPAGSASTAGRSSSAVLRSVTVTRAPRACRKRAAPRPPPLRPSPMTVARSPRSSAAGRPAVSCQSLPGSRPFPGSRRPRPAPRLPTRESAPGRAARAARSPTPCRSSAATGARSRARRVDRSR